ncbi:hypothetical protein V8E51_013717 [Hyaloscypha variabilis]
MKLLSLLAWLAFAVSADALVAGENALLLLPLPGTLTGSADALLEERTSRLVKRSVWEKCGPNMDTDAAMSGTRRNVDIIFIDHNATSFEKLMELPKKPMAAL